MTAQPQPQILQIMPAEGWYVSWTEKDADGWCERKPEPLVGWALVQDDNGDTYVLGMYEALGVQLVGWLDGERDSDGSFLYTRDPQTVRFRAPGVAS